MKWFLIFIMLSSNGTVETVILNQYDTQESCWEQADLYYEQGPLENAPLNWDFVCLEDIREEI